MLFLYIHVGNRQKLANSLIEASGLRMLAVEDFDVAAKTVSRHSQENVVYNTLPTPMLVNKLEVEV